jgi:hypothetical protein
LEGMSERPTTRRYTVRVSAAEIGPQWAARLEISDPSGVVYEAELSDVLFSSAAEAEAAGWRLAEEWVQRTADAPPQDDRRLLMQCDHPVARCEACAISHGFFELVSDRFCARCRRDLIAQVHVHLNACPDLAIRRSHAAIRTAQLLGKHNREIRDAAGVTRAESDSLRESARAVRGAPSARDCSHCGRPIEPGEGVSFQRGTLMHLRCYERRR